MPKLGNSNMYLRTSRQAPVGHRKETSLTSLATKRTLVGRLHRLIKHFTADGSAINFLSVGSVNMSGAMSQAKQQGLSRDGLPAAILRPPPPALNFQTNFVKMEMEQTSGSCPAQGQAAVRTWLASSTRGISRTHNDIRSRFHGDGVRYKAKVIGIDPVPAAQGDKMCLDSMMKLKGFEAAARRQGRHKQRVWLKLTSNGLTILDERTGAVVHDHERSRISSLTKDESDPRALAYIYQHQDAYSLFYIKTANLADPVLADIRDVCQSVDQETPQQPAEAPTQGFLALEDVFSPRPDSTTGQLTQVSSTQELMEVFSTQMQEPMSSIQSSCPSQPDKVWTGAGSYSDEGWSCAAREISSQPGIHRAKQPEPPQPPQPMLSTSQILSMFPTQPLGGSPYVSPTYSPTAMPWDQGDLWETSGEVHLRALGQLHPVTWQRGHQ
ncbi:hypothetical protein INR49_025377 [Caranx melampygus]|nr:hypothetical protein INR49_025377 [Caranx melampygus]